MRNLLLSLIDVMVSVFNDTVQWMQDHQQLMLGIVGVAVVWFALSWRRGK